MLVWVVDCWSKTANSVLARQHDYPVLAIPAGIDSDGVQVKVSVRNLLPGVFMIITVLIDHYSPALRYFNADQYKPVLSTNLT